MKFSYTEEEIKILTNFNGIHDSIVIYPDKFMIVNGLNKSVIGIYDFKEPYEYEPFGVYDLKEFLSSVNLYQSELEIFEKYISISNTKLDINTKYRNTEISILPKAKDLRTKLDSINWELEFTLTAEKYAIIKKVVNIFEADKIYFRSVDDKTVRLIICKKLSAHNTPELQENATEIILKDDEVISSILAVDELVSISVEYFKLIEGDYSTKVAAQGITQWTNKNIENLTYFIVCDKIGEEL